MVWFTRSGQSKTRQRVWHSRLCWREVPLTSKPKRHISGYDYKYNLCRYSLLLPSSSCLPIASGRTTYTSEKNQCSVKLPDKIRTWTRSLWSRIRFGIAKWGLIALIYAYPPWSRLDYEWITCMYVRRFSYIKILLQAVLQCSTMSGNCI